MGFFLSKVAGCDLTEKRTSSQFLSSECFVKFFRSAFLKNIFVRVLLLLSGLYEMLPVF